MLSRGENGLILERGSNPVESDEGGNGSRDRHVEDEIVGFNFREEFAQLSQNKRKKKSLNKKIKSMREIQNGVLSTKEKQKRDRKEKLKKRKTVATGMRIVSWNIRGLGSEVKKASVNRNCRLARANVCFLQETKLELINMDVSVLWGVLMELRIQFASPWIMGGDFNVVRCRSERSRCMGSANGSKEFDNFIQNCKLIDLPLVGKKFTWYGPDNKKSKLDRFLVEEHWMIKIKDLQQLGLKRSVSDYIPILLADAEIDWGPRPFKFINGWLRNK
ncbi:hypothetical protein PVK06_000556 [Gossypium arboreum]|uniref:Endonuclease/exonuclease/phosphatase domain-containing protein n=1 Tax=Gossypium arboreum TaxID=29729 RepID=A0ABR0QZY6_GOSAR|nr:hypothetical protein PVK06_000556 [Gossypium arboreum]